MGEGTSGWKKKLKSLAIPTTPKKLPKNSPILKLNSSAAITTPSKSPKDKKLNKLPTSAKRLFVDHTYTKSSDMLMTIPKSSEMPCTFTPSPAKRKFFENVSDQSVLKNEDVEILKRSNDKKNILIRSLRQKMKIGRKKLCDKKKELENITKGLNQFLTSNQITALTRKKKNWFKWSDSSIKNALQVKFACGSSGYEELINLKYPLPSLRTLRR